MMQTPMMKRPGSGERHVRVSSDSVTLEGVLALPRNACGVVLFAHGSGSSRRSPRNRFVAEVLQEGGIGTLLIDLLTEEEEVIDMTTRQLRFDIPLLAGRLAGAIDWLTADDETRDLPIGLFGASTGAAAALIAAAARPDVVRAVVSRGGRPDLAGDALPKVNVPTLLIVGGHDAQVMALNQEAQARLRSETRLVTVAGATHLFEEPGALEEVAAHARDWFSLHLPSAGTESQAAG